MRAVFEFREVPLMNTDAQTVNTPNIQNGTGTGRMSYPMPLRAIHRKRNSTDTFLTVARFMLLDWTVISEKCCKINRGETEGSGGCY
jgi:hypothetical protein